jgi:hypothetical protein
MAIISLLSPTPEAEERLLTVKAKVTLKKACVPGEVM